MLADELDYVVGVDTHRDQHTLAIVAAPTGALIAQQSVGADGRGYAAAVRFAEKHAPGVRVWAIGRDGLSWPHHDGLIWPHPCPTAGRPSELHRARAGGRRRDGIESGAVRADP
jgi:hypothetical protein